jgi:protein SCO1/2
MRSQIICAMVILGSVFSPGLSAHEHHEHAVEKTSAPSKDSLFNLHSKWQTQEGKDVELEMLRGRPAVLAMAYTSCPSSCPMIVEEMRQIAARLKNKDAARFVFASFDAKRDTPERLKKFAGQRKLDLNRWVLLHGSPNSVQELAAALGVRYKEDAQGEFDHSNVITLIDAEGVIRFQESGLGQETQKLEEKLSSLAEGHR